MLEQLFLIIGRLSLRFFKGQSATSKVGIASLFAIDDMSEDCPRVFQVNYKLHNQREIEAT